MKRFKILSVFLILAVALAGGLQAASLIPHVHEHDTDHSSHASCPVHQAQYLGSQTINADAPIAPTLLQRGTIVPPAADSFTYQTFFLQESLRAPPASF